MNSFGLPHHSDAVDQCAKGLKAAYSQYVSQLGIKLLSLPRRNKRWWGLTNEILGKAPKSSTIPALKLSDGSWASTPTAKAN
eukprot:5373198-Karenia_brevis.AAC.1